MDTRTTEILRLFHASWDKTEAFYDNLLSIHPDYDEIRSLRLFISKLRRAGEDNFFRLGTSMHALMISRSVKHFLRNDQKYIRIEVIKTADIEVILRDGPTTYREYRAKDFDDIRISKLLKTLKDTLVD